VYGPVAEASSAIYYFEAVRRANRKDGSMLSLKVGGWLRRDSNDHTSAFALSGSVVEDESMWSVTPLAIVRVAGRVFWVATDARYESSSFIIRDVSPGAVRDVLTTDNGGC
jgi:hypothetical protein